MYNAITGNEFFSSTVSIVVMFFLAANKDYLTPDIFHFLTCVDEEEVHYIFATGLWLYFKCLLEPSAGHMKQVPQSKYREERLKIIIRSAMELAISLLALQSITDSLWHWAYCFSVFILASARTLYKDQLDLTAFIFLFVYFSQNFLINMIDFIFFKHYMGFYHDEMFLKMFSFKIWQFAMCLLVSFIYSQTLRPTIQTLKQNPQLLITLFQLLLPINILMMFTFLYELTVYDQEHRTQIFRSALSKVFFTTLALYFIAIIFSHWIQ